MRLWGMSLSVLLVCCISGCATAGLPETDAAQPWPLAVRVMSYGKYQDAAWAHLQEIGVKHVFMAVPAVEQVDAEMQRLAQFGLKPLVVRCGAELAADPFLDDIAVQLATCEKMGVKYMFMSAKRGELSKEAAYERLRAAGDIAHKHGVTITLETHPDLGTNGAVQVETMQAINHPNIRVNLDTANVTYYNKDTSAVAELAKSIDYVGTVEFKDHSGAFETWEFPVLGYGIVDFPKIVEILREHGYAGPVTLEFEGIKGVELTGEQTKQAIADSVAYARSLGCFE